jgi:hypothetical protein
MHLAQRLKPGDMRQMRQPVMFPRKRAGPIEFFFGVDGYQKTRPAQLLQVYAIAMTWELSIADL